MAMDGARATHPLTVIDLFSGCGGMSYGFSARTQFRVLCGADIEYGKPSQGEGVLQCNETYTRNIGAPVLAQDIGALSPEELSHQAARQLGKSLERGELSVLIACPPCTDFSRAKPENHLNDSPKNSLVRRIALFADVLLPEFIVMENARELIRGNNSHHFQALKSDLELLGYQVDGRVYRLEEFGLPQVRERAIVLASRIGPVRNLQDLWRGLVIDSEAITVRRAIGPWRYKALEAGVASDEDPQHVSPGFESDTVRERISAIPKDGGSWFDLATHPEAERILTRSMLHRLRQRNLGSHPDVYGRLAWSRPAPTIKRECAHVGNGRYSHPEQDRLLTVREMAALQGFPTWYDFGNGSLANRYRQIGDAVPPLISFQLSALILWMKTHDRPRSPAVILEGTSLRPEDVVQSRAAKQAQLPFDFTIDLPARTTAQCET